jgi:hypothetical protein
VANLGAQPALLGRLQLMKVKTAAKHAPLVA